VKNVFKPSEYFVQKHHGISLNVLLDLYGILKENKMTESQKRVKLIIEKLQKYINTYSDQYGYLEYSDDTIIKDMLYGLGIALNEKEYTYALGFNKFKKFLHKYIYRKNKRSDMSGGHFNYNQYRINEIADEIKNIIKNNNVRNEFGHPGDIPDDVIDDFKEAVRLLEKASVYVQRIDWFISDDDGVESFRERLKEDLEELKSKSSD